MTATIAIVGLLVLFGLAAVAGLVDGRSQQSAWNRIARARREIADDRSVIAQWTAALDKRQDDLGARDRRMQAAETHLAVRMAALDDRARTLDRRERALDEQDLPTSGPMPHNRTAPVGDAPIGRRRLRS